MKRDYLTSAEVVRRFGISRRTLGRWMQTGYLVPAIRRGRVLRFAEADLASIHRRDVPEGEIVGSRTALEAAGYRRDASEKLQ